MIYNRIQQKSYQNGNTVVNAIDKTAQKRRNKGKNPHFNSDPCET